MARNKPEIYKRGQFSLRWDRKADGSLRSPFLAIFWYDPERRRERSTSTGTSDVEQAKLKLDIHYLENTRGEALCHACGQRLPGAGERLLVADAITNYLALHAKGKDSENAIKARLAHVVSYLETLPKDIKCAEVNDAWIERFRSWALAQPIVSPKGKTRERTRSTVENSVLQLAAAINFAKSRGDALEPAAFKPIPSKEVNRTPRFRATVERLAEMFKYATDKRYKVRREGLHRFLIASVATLGRPDAVHDISMKPERGQWDSAHEVLDLNPRGRRQTKKYRAVVRVPYQVVPWFDACDGYFVPVKSVRSAWRGMAQSLGLPGEGEAGMKLIRRSVAKLVRDRLSRQDEGEVSMVLGHSKFDTTSDIYAPFEPSYVANALRVLEEIIDEIEAHCPGAFHLPHRGGLSNVVPIAAAKIS